MRPAHRVAFASLCLLSGSRWLLLELSPSTLPTTLGSAVHAALLTLVFAAFSRFRLVNLRTLVLPVAGAFTLPSLAFALAEGHVTPTTETVLFALSPAVVIFALSQQTRSFGPEPAYRDLFLPALAGVFGTMLLVPATLPSSLGSYAHLALLVTAMIVAGFSAVRLHRSLRGLSIISTAALASTLNMLVLGLVAFTSRLSWSQVGFVREATLALALDAPILLLTLYLLRELDPVHAASRFLLVPFIVVSEGLLLLRPHPTPTMAAGLLILFLSVVLLLRSTPPEASNAL